MNIEFYSRSPPAKVLIEGVSHAVRNGLPRVAVHKAVKALSPAAVSKFNLDHCAKALEPLAALSNRSRSALIPRIHPYEFERAVDVLARRVKQALVAGEEANQGTVALLATTLAKLRVNDDALVSALVGRATHPVPRMLACRWLAEIDAPARAEARDALQHAVDALPGMSRQALWALHLALSAVMLCPTRSSLEPFAPVVTSSLAAFGDSGLRDAVALARVVALDAPDLLPAGVAVPPTPASSRRLVSAFEQDVAHELAQLGLAFAVEEEVDLVVDVDLGGGEQRRVGLQCDGPSHFVWDGSRREGRTVLRDRQQRARFDALVAISYAEWPTSSGARSALVRARVGLPPGQNLP